MDRVVIATAAPVIEKEYGFSPVTMGWIFASFSIAYALFQIPGGWLGDRFGPRRALTGVVLWWSTFTAATALTWSAGSMMVCRFLFGMGEAGAFPIATRRPEEHTSELRYLMRISYAVFCLKKKT